MENLGEIPFFSCRKKYEILSKSLFNGSDFCNYENYDKFVETESCFYLSF